ncbi:melatonin receptor type 1B-A-like [Paramacrobiotus metropolitanus]|uniref:melatonin receptor type 1B-A-like n=1 Tax=Paramacrobiotus metropolitanus TaxID=2943436 RepID=UPI0024460BB2|nr:melatonin receptor type 1B-A-like [Paramacrobiotus metropolitanus]XP_055345958.1 melatonin receptor type 1B-A-like [Paramacrobiotus metropolitanus]
MDAKQFHNFTDMWKKPSIDETHLLLWIILMLLIFIGGTLGNLLTIIAIMTTKKLQTHSNILVLNMAVVDCLLSSVIYPIKVIMVLLYNFLPYTDQTKFEFTIFCRYYGFINVALSFSSNMTSCAIAVNRFIAIVYARKYHTMQKLPLFLLMILMPWIVPLGVSSLGLLDRYGGDSFHLTPIGLCTFNLDLQTASNHNWKFIIAMAVPCLMLPTLIIAASYVAIYLKVIQVRRNLRRAIYSPVLRPNNLLTDSSLSCTNTNGCVQAPTVICVRLKRFEHRVKGARMMFICFTMFCATYYPATVVVAVAKHFKSRILLDCPPLLLWVFGLYFAGCCINPIVYAWMNSDFRKAFKGLLYAFGGKLRDIFVGRILLLTRRMESHTFARFCCMRSI